MATSITRLNERRRDSSTSRHNARTPPPLVLVVDDHEDTRFMLTTLLGRYGYDVVEAADGVEALRLIESKRPDVVLMDGSLPRLDGLTTTRRIRESSTFGSIPIILISGHIEPSYRMTAFAVGCDDFLIKPIDFARLEDALKKFTGEKSHAMRVPLETAIYPG